jgi:hypothetical protein
MRGAKRHIFGNAQPLVQTEYCESRKPVKGTIHPSCVVPSRAKAEQIEGHQAARLKSCSATKPSRISIEMSFSAASKTVPFQSVRSPAGFEVF